MNSLLPIFLAIQGSVFLVWTVLAFRWLFALRADAVAISGRTLPNMSATFEAFRGGLVDPRYRRYRLGFSVLTALLMALSALTFLFSK
ncbi:hypothetical protein ACK6D9_06670 [Hoeflea sp. Naph1]|uniref:hypothetical protein n=1 Tax=Hoeflea sp. Naph1 TaxID=3388653 RepID=UPI003990161D